MDIVERAAARSGGIVPAPVHVDERIVEVDVGVLVCRRKENVIVHEARRERDAPGETDGGCVLWKIRRYGIVIGLPVKSVRTKPDDVLVLRCAFCDGVFGVDIGIERRVEQPPCSCGRSEEKRRAEQREPAVPQKAEDFLHRCSPLRREKEKTRLIPEFYLIISYLLDIEQ